jgi:hypothetical protein
MPLPQRRWVQNHFLGNGKARAATQVLVDGAGRLMQLTVARHLVITVNRGPAVLLCAPFDVSDQADEDTA